MPFILCNKTDCPAEIAEPDQSTKMIAKHLVSFFAIEVDKGNLTKSLLPLQTGIGKVANAILDGIRAGDFENLTMYSEVLKDSTFDLLDSGKLTYASGSSIIFSESYYKHIFGDFNKYNDKVM
ncbi:acyl-CoA hydrolase [Pedobacter sp. CG_S7]|uniref:hypothetical protein n=1 Tax=Pedobacter sp. CG_S7 TaxID=3143930 RepID=UPI0033977733